MLRCAFSLAVALVSGCASLDYHFDVDVPTELSQQESVSVFGVYRNGRMDTDYWQQIEPTIAQSLHAENCASVYSTRLKEEDPTSFQHIANESKESGTSPTVVGSVSDRALADYVLVFQISGRTPRLHQEKSPGSYDRERTSAANGSRNAAGGMPGGGFPGASGGRPGGMGGGGMGRGGGGMGRGGNGPRPIMPTEDPAEQIEKVLEMKAKLFSRQKHEYVAFVGMRYSGQNGAEALDTFAKKIGTMFPNLRCVDWKWAASQPVVAETPNPAH